MSHKTHNSSGVPQRGFGVSKETHFEISISS